MFKKNNNILVGKIYQNIIEISRSKFFYIELELADTFETRFDLVIFHSFMIFYFYKINNKNNSDISQNLFDLMFEDFENNLREMGFGDIAVNKKMKAFIRAFYGRLSQYSKSLDLIFKQGDNSLLEETISNNIYKGKSSSKEHLLKFENYMINNIKIFLSKTEKENLKNNFDFSKFG